MDELYGNKLVSSYEGIHPNGGASTDSVQRWAAAKTSRKSGNI